MALRAGCLFVAALTVPVVVVPRAAAQAPSPRSPATAAVPAAVPTTTPNIVAVVDQMRVFTQALGVECLFCHVDGPNGRLNYRSDDNPRKQVARSMIAMTADINRMVGLGHGDDPVDAGHLSHVPSRRAESAADCRHRAAHRGA